jgi:uncharacterized protein YdhG (YjbR/CyaY superfamily)
MARMRKAKGNVGKSPGKGASASTKGKPVRSQGKRATATGKGAPKNVDKYFARVPEPARSWLKEMRAVIRSVLPAEAVEIISYQIPAFKTKKVLIWYAAFAEHCSLFPTASVIEEFKDELGGYRKSKGTVQFPLDKALPTALIKKLVKARVAQSEKAQRG